MRRIIVLIAAFALLSTGCANAWSGLSLDSEEAPGVTSSSITVGGVASITSPIGDSFGTAEDGVNAYFAMVNEEGGVAGRKLVMLPLADDNTQASRNVSEVRKLVEEDHVFAILPMASPLFASSSYLADRNIPTFGWAVNTEWGKGPSLFGQSGSRFCIDCGSTFSYLPFVAKSLGVKRVGILAYSVAQAKQCASGQEKALQRFGYPVAFKDDTLSFGFTDVSAAIARIKSSDVELLATCLDGDGSARVSKALRDANVNIKQYWPIGYDPSLLKQFAPQMEGIYMQTTFVPFELAKSAPGMQSYLKWMKKTGGKPNEISLAAWLNADLFVRGLRDVGPDLTRDKLIKALNKITNYTGGGIVRPVDWTQSHGELTEQQMEEAKNSGVKAEACLSYSTVKNGKFTPAFVTEKEPWICLDPTANTIPDDPVRRPVDIPDAADAAAAASGEETP